MKSIELFAGIGGIALAAEWAGIETVAFCEREPFCQKVLNKHWPSVPIFDDIRTLNKKALQERGVDVGAIELISGGFPCQPYSIAGKRKGTEDDRDLWPEMFRIIQELQPTWVVGENVANFANMELERTCTDLENEGYETQSFIIPAAAIDAKHQRYRTFVVAYSHSAWELQQKRSIEKIGRRLSNSCEILVNSNGLGCQTDNDENRNIEKRKNKRKFSPTDSTPGKWSVEPSMGRVADGVPNRVDRIRGLGNAVVPQQIYPILHYIKQIRDMETQE